MGVSPCLLVNIVCLYCVNPNVLCHTAGCCQITVLPNAETDSMGDSQPEEILLDENAEAARYEFYMVGGLEPSPNHKLLAYAEDTSGNEKYTLHVKDIESDREVLKEPIKVTPGAACNI